MKSLRTMCYAGFVVAFLSAGFAGAAFATDYYVNDASTNGDIWCATPGSSTNNGLTPASPAATIQQIINTNTLAGGDVVYVDCGSYWTNGTVIGAADSGSSGGGVVTIRGAGRNATLIYRNSASAGAYAFHLNAASYVRIENLGCRSANQAVRIENSDHITVDHCDLRNSNLGLVVAGGNQNTLSGSRVEANSDDGVLASASTLLTLSGNHILNNGDADGDRGAEFSSCSLATIAGNAFSNNVREGLYLQSCASAVARDNVIVGGTMGLYAKSCSAMLVSNNTLRSSTQGLYAYDSGALRLLGNRIYSHGGYGVHVENGTFEARNNLLYVNGAYGLETLNPGASTIANNTFYRNGTAQLRLWGNYANTDARNNIIAANGVAQTCLQVSDIGSGWTCDFNDFQAAGGSSLWDWKGQRYSLGSWQKHSSQDRRSLDVDPRFVDPDGADNVLGGAQGGDDDFHLQSTAGSWHGGAWSNDAALSTCVDAGDPTAAFASEPAPNGGRVNLGAYGNTAEASKSGGLRVLQLLHPNGGEIAFRALTIRWMAPGPWATSDDIKLEYSANNGATWLAIAGANPLDYYNGYYDWDISGLAPGTQYRIRVTYLSDTNLFDDSDASFEIQSPGAKILYVNDGTIAGDEWCTAAGSATNTGLSAASPLDSLSFMLEKYPAIGAGDEIRADAGTLDAGRMIWFTADNNGTAASNLTLRGTAAGTTIFDGAARGWPSLYFEDPNYLRLANVRVTRATPGFQFAGDPVLRAQGLVLTGCWAYSGGGDGFALSSCEAPSLDACVASGNSGIGFNLASTLNARLVNCTAETEGSHGIYLDDHSQTVVLNGNLCRNNGGRGIYVYNAGTGSASECSTNQCYNNGSHGIEAHGRIRYAANLCRNNNGHGLYLNSGDSELLNNQCYSNTESGIYSSDGYAIPISGNVCYANSEHGIYRSGGSGAISDNRCYRNGQDGIFFAWGSSKEARRNIVYSNGGHGIDTWGRSGEVIANNLAYNNGTSGSGYNIYFAYWGDAHWYDNYGQVLNNTMYGGNGLFVGHPVNVTVQNNLAGAAGGGMTAIVVAGTPVGGDVFNCDYNNWYASGGAAVGFWQGTRPTLGTWQGVSGRDANSVAIEPRFVNAAGGDFHERSPAGSYRGEPFTAPGGGVFTNDADLSFCIDGGNPASAYSNETAYNGSRINLGAFGNTPDASRSTTLRTSLLMDPAAGVQWFGTRTISWLTRGTWLPGETVTLEYSEDGGINWSSITSGVSYALGAYAWDTSARTPGTNYLVRIFKSDDLSVMATNAGLFTIQASGLREYFVNDGFTNNDVYCSAIGSDANDGLATNTPKATLQAILDAYDLAPGDTVKIDTGNYTLPATVIVTAQDQGEAGNPVTFIGSTHPDGSIFNRNDTGQNGIYLNGVDYVTFANLRVRNASVGIFLDGQTSDYCNGIQVLGCVVYSNNSHGIYADYNNSLAIQGCTMWTNNASGAYLDYCYGVTVSSNTSYGSKTGYGIWLQGGGGISGNLVCNNRLCGIYTTSAGNNLVTISGNEVHHNGPNDAGGNKHGISFTGGPGIIQNNIVHHNGHKGIYVNSASATVSDNIVYQNNNEGIYLAGYKSGLPVSVIERNRSYLNGNDGIFFYGSAHIVRQNAVYNNGWNGVATRLADNEQILNNLCYSNNTSAGAYYNIYAGYYYADAWTLNRGTIRNNTMYGGNGLFLGNPTNVVIENNIFWATGNGSVACKIQTWSAGSTWVQDYNNLYATGGAAVGFLWGLRWTLPDWQFNTGRDTHSFAMDPVLVNPAGADGILGGLNGLDDDFHLMSAAGSYTGAAFTAVSTNQFATNALTSFCVDAGRPSTSVGSELEPNGGRVNLGAFGGTADASLSPGVCLVQLVSPLGGEVIRGARNAAWVTSGPWAAGDTVRLEYSSDGGTNWTQILGAETLDYSAGRFSWDTSALGAGSNYVLRITGSMGAPAVDTSGVFRIMDAGPAVFYVNDGSTNRDVYCSAIGDDAHDGVTPATPKATLKCLLREFTLVPGDLVMMDTGFWLLDADVGIVNSGSPAQPITFLGSTNAAGTVLNRNDMSYTALNLVGDYLRLQYLCITNSGNGIGVWGSTGYRRRGVSILDCRSYNNNYGIQAQYTTNLVIQGCATYRDALGGIYLTYSDSAEVSGCNSFTNGDNKIGISLDYCMDANIVSNSCHDHLGSYSKGIYLRGSGVIRGNDCAANGCGIHAVNWNGPVTIAENHVYDNRQTYRSGIEVEAGSLYCGIQNNLVHGNYGGGIILSDGASSVIEDNRVYLNGEIGILADQFQSRTIRRNVVYSNNKEGIRTWGRAGELVNNNLVYDNDRLAGGYYNIYVGDGSASVNIFSAANNTVFGRNGIYIENAQTVTLANNILCSSVAGCYAIAAGTPSGAYTFSSGNNCFWVTNTARIGYWDGVHDTLEDWRFHSGLDASSFVADPLFTDPDGPDNVYGGGGGLDDNFHPMSAAGSFPGLSFTAASTAGFVTNALTSPCVDAGAPASAVGSELAPNGSRINLGAFGGTTDASLSPELSSVALLTMTGGDVLRGTRSLNWRTTGPWATGDTVCLQYSTNHGAAWLDMAGATNLPYALGAYAWDTGALTPDSNYLLRIVGSSGAAITSGLVRIIANAPATFYLNDSSTSNDVYCAAVGDDAHDGISPATPKATVKRLQEAFTLIPGDLVELDTGTFLLDANLIMRSSGTAAQPIRFLGSTHPDGTLIHRNNTGMNAIQIDRADYVRLESLRVTGGSIGVRVDGASAGNTRKGIEVARCELFSNRDYGLYADYCTNLAVSGCSIHNNNAARPLYLNYCYNVSVASNVIHDPTSKDGLYLRGSGRVEGCEVYNHKLGMELRADVGSPLLVARNRVHHNTAAGVSLYASAPVTTQANMFDHNGQEGFRIEGGGWGYHVVESNRVFQNGYSGMYIVSVGTGSHIRKNIVYSNGRHGIWAWAADNLINIYNNLLYANSTSGSGYYNIYLWAADWYASTKLYATVEDNTCYGGNGILFRDAYAVSFRNNIMQATGIGSVGLYLQEMDGTFSSDYNDLYPTASAIAGVWLGTRCTNLTDWRATSGRDANSRSADPLFVNMLGPDGLLGGDNGVDDDFHLQSCAGSWHGGLWTADPSNSPCIDAGDWWSSAYMNEPDYNGLVLNQGVYGGTEQASKTYYSGPFCALAMVTNPAFGGTLVVWPAAASYPTNRPLRITATPGVHFTWGEWSGVVNTTANPAVFYLPDSTSVTGTFVARCGNTYGVPNWWLAQYNLPTNQAGAAADTDVDRYFNWEEYFADTVPTNRNSALNLVSIRRTNSIAVWITCTNSRVYDLEYTDHLVTGAWVEIPSQARIPGAAGGLMSLIDTNTIYPRCYRVRVSFP